MKRPFHNTTNKPLYKGPTLIQPGESRDVDEIYLDAVEAKEESAPELSHVQEVQALSIKEATSEFGTLTDDQLDDLEALETNQERPRKGLLDNITIEKLDRASSNDEPSSDESDDEPSTDESDDKSGTDDDTD